MGLMRDPLDLFSIQKKHHQNIVLNLRGSSPTPKMVAVVADLESPG